jgi:hypothetical protein
LLGAGGRFRLEVNASPVGTQDPCCRGSPSQRIDQPRSRCFGGELAPVVKNATATIPIVVVGSNDPVASGLVASLGRPGGNITGVTYVNDQLAGKTIELLKEMAPWVSRAGILWNPNHTDPEFRETQRAAGAPARSF